MTSKFQILDAPAALPGCCFMCRSHDRKFFVDTLMHIEAEDNEPFTGAVYICSECLREMAQEAGFLTVEQAEKLVAANIRLEDRAYESEQRQVKLENAISALSDLVTDSPDLPVILSALDEDAESDASGATESKGSSNKRSSKSGAKQGLGNLFET